MATIDQLFSAIERATPGQNPFSQGEQETLLRAEAQGTLAAVLNETSSLRARLNGVLEDATYQAALADQVDAWRALLKLEASGAYEAARRRWALPFSSSATPTPDELEKVLRPEIDRLKGEADALDLRGNADSAAERYLEAALLSNRLAWAFRKKSFDDLLILNAGADPEGYFRLKRPESSSRADDYFHKTRTFLDQVDRRSDTAPNLALNAERINELLAAYSKGDVESAYGILQQILDNNLLVSSHNHFVLTSLYDLLELETRLVGAHQTGNHAETRILLPKLGLALRSVTALLRDLHPGLMDRHPDLKERLYGRLKETIYSVVPITLGRRNYPSPEDWYNFFVEYNRELRVYGDLATEGDRILAEYWELRFGRIYYVRLGRISFRPEHPEKLDALLPQLRELATRGVIPAEWLTDAIDFRARLEEHLTTRQPIRLFPDTANEENVLSVAREVVRLGRESRTIDWRRHPVKAVKRYVHKKQDEMTKLLAKHPDLLERMMKFTDALPEIENDPKEVVQHFRDYFPAPDSRLPPSVNRAIRLAHSPRIPARIVAFGIKKVIEVMAYRYLSAETPKKAYKDFLRMGKEGMGVIGDILGEAVTNDDEADAYKKSYFDLIDDLSANKPLIAKLRANRANHTYLPAFSSEDQPDFQLAIKFSALCPYSRWNSSDPDGTAEIVKGRFRQILQKIQEAEKKHGVKIQLTADPEEYEFRDLAMKIYKEVMMEPKYREMRNVGIGIQLYLKDSLGVLADLIAWSEARGGSVPIRLIKGAYWDFENLTTSQKGYSLPVWPEKWMSDVAFERGVDLALSHFKAVRVAVGSHNTRALAYAISESRRRKIPVEIQMLYGMADETKRALVAMGIPISVYSPVGRLLQGMAYFARRILENASQNSFLLQSSDMTEEEIIELLKKPLPEGKEWPPQFAPDPVPFTYRVTDLGDPFENEPLTEYWKESNLEIMG